MPEDEKMIIKRQNDTGAQQENRDEAIFDFFFLDKQTFFDFLIMWKEAGWSITVQKSGAR